MCVWRFGEGRVKQSFGLDWVLSGREDNSLIGFLSKPVKIEGRLQ